MEPEVAALLYFLDAQRRSVLSIVAGLDEEALNARPVPSGWSPLGLIEHLGYAERFWFQSVALGEADPLPWPDGDRLAGDNPLHTRRPADVVLSFYEAQCRRSRQVLTTTPLATPPARPDLAAEETDDEVADLRWIALHMVEETARHAGHLDIARELLDGRTGLGPR